MNIDVATRDPLHRGIIAMLSTTKFLGAFGLIALLASCSGDTTNPGGGSNPPPPPPGPAPVASISVAPVAPIVIGKTAQLAAVVKDAQGNELVGRVVTYASNAEAIATVSGTGLVSAVALGNTAITVTSEGKTAQAPIAVAGVPVATVAITPNNAILKVGRDSALVAVLEDEAGQVLAGREIQWSSNDPAIASVGATTGIVTAVTAGNATIKAISEGKEGTAQITVVPVAVASVAIAPATMTLKLGRDSALVVSARDDQGGNLPGRAFTYTSSNVAVATVSAAGVVTAVDAGQATITATSEGKSAQAAITVVAPVALVQIAVPLDTIEAHDFQQLQVTLKDAKGRILQGRPVTWTSSATPIATVDAEGILNGLDRGTVTVTATSEGISGTVSRVVVIRYRSLSVGTMHACDIASGGLVWCWGLNGNEGPIGSANLGAGSFSSVPVLVTDKIYFVQLATYGTTTCGISNTGKGYCWGSNSWGALGTGGAASQSTSPVPLAGNLTLKSIAAGTDHACAITTVGELYCWGHDDWRQFGNGVSGTSSIPVRAAGGRTFTAIAAGPGYTCGIGTDGVTWCMGASGLGQLGDGKPLSYGNTFTATPSAVVGGHAFKAITAGSQFACGLTTGNQVWCWGSNNNGKLGNGAAGTDTSTPVLVSGGLSFQQVSAGYGHACATAADGAGYCWGGNGNGQLGSAAPGGSAVPTRAAGSSLFAQVAAAGIGTGNGAHSCGIAADRLTVQCWGRNDFGQLGNNTTSASGASNPTPAIVVGQKPLPKT